MTIRYGNETFFTSSGNLAASFGENFRDAIVGHACDIWGNFPDYFTQGKNPVSSFARGYMNAYCNARGDTPPPAPTQPFTGGQCEAIEYDVLVEYQRNPTEPVLNETARVFGAIGGVRIEQNPDIGNRYELILSHFTAPPSSQSTETVLNAWTAALGGDNFANIVSNTRVDGLPDNCGDPNPAYPVQPPPTQQDLSTTINITNIDGLAVDFDVQYNKTDVNSNFPISFKVNGINVTLDGGGLNIYGDINVVSSNDGNQGQDPGDDGGTDVDGNKYTSPFPDQDYPALPQLTVPEQVEASFDYALCEADVITPIVELVKLPAGYDIIFKIILKILEDIIEDVCGGQAGETGLPETYPVLPGVERPVIMYFFKEVIAGKKQMATYVSSLPNPSGSAVSEIPTVNVPSRNLGRFITSIALTDGSRLVARGNTAAESDSFFTFLLSRADPALIPVDVPGKKVLTENQRLQDVSVQCTRIEYYSMGKNFNRAPDQIRSIPV